MEKTIKKSQKRFERVYGHEAVFEPDLKVGGYTVFIPTLPGCISEGDTHEEALKNIKVMRALCITPLRDRDLAINFDKNICENSSLLFHSFPSCYI